MKKSKKRNIREEGTVLIIVVLILMVATATGVYATHAATSELAGSGASRTAYQAEEAARSMVEGTIDYSVRIGPANLYRRATQLSSGFVMTGTETPSTLAPGMIGMRVYHSEIVDTLPVIGPENINSGVNQSIFGVTDIYDMHRYQGNISGVRSDGYGNSFYLKSTLTGRVRIRANNLPNNPDIIDRHTTDSSSRSMVTFGPFNL